MSGRTLVVGDPLVVLGEVGVIRDGAMVIEDGRVTRVGTRAEFENADGGYARVIGSPGHAVLPGFVNSHHHSECNLVQGVYDTIFDLANLWVHGLLGEIDEDDLYDVLMAGLIDTVRGGQTCVVDAYYGRRGLPNFSADVALQAHWDLGTRVGFGLSFRDRNRYTHEGDDRFLSRLPADVADEIRASDMGYAWPVDEVEQAYRRLVDDWDGRGGRILADPIDVILDRADLSDIDMVRSRGARSPTTAASPPSTRPPSARATPRPGLRGTGVIARWMTRFGSRARRCAPHRQTEGDP